MQRLFHWRQYQSYGRRLKLSDSAHFVRGWRVRARCQSLRARVRRTIFGESNLVHPQLARSKMDFAVWELFAHEQLEQIPPSKLQAIEQYA